MKFRFCLSLSIRYVTRALLGYLAKHAPLAVRGGADFAPLPRLTRERVTVARRTRRQSKVFDEYFLSNVKIFLKGHMSGQGKVQGQNR